MGNETKINPFARILNAVTKVNPDLENQKDKTTSETVVNSEISQTQEKVQERVLLDKYSVVRPLDVASGEADLYLCNYQEKLYVAKIYRRDVAIKSEVMQALLIHKPYNKNTGEITWECSTLRNWLNSIFYMEAFEKKRECGLVEAR